MNVMFKINMIADFIVIVTYETAYDFVLVL